MEDKLSRADFSISLQEKVSFEDMKRYVTLNSASNAGTNNNTANGGTTNGTGGPMANR